MTRSPVFTGLAQGIKPKARLRTTKQTELAEASLAVQRRIAAASERQAAAAERIADVLDDIAVERAVAVLLDEIAAIPAEPKTRAVVKRAATPVWLEFHLKAWQPGTPIRRAFEQAERITRAAREREIRTHLDLQRWTQA